MYSKRVVLDDRKFCFSCSGGIAYSGLIIVLDSRDLYRYAGLLLSIVQYTFGGLSMASLCVTVR